MIIPPTPASRWCCFICGQRQAIATEAIQTEMAISLFCYSSRTADDVKGILDSLIMLHRDFIAEKFLVSSVDDLRSLTTYFDSVLVEIALEYGIRVSCLFLVDLNGKSAAGLLPAVEAIIKSALGDSNVLILFNNEERR